MSNFMESMSKELAMNTLQNTENGALGHTTTSSALLDMNFKVTSYRNLTDDVIVSDFMKAYDDNPVLAIRWLFYARDARSGLGERRLFRVILSHFANSDDIKQYAVASALLDLVAEYGRWDDLFVVSETKLHNQFMSIIDKQLLEDYKNMEQGKSVSLLAKWMPSEKSKSADKRKLAKRLIKDLRLTPKIYRTAMSSLRSYIDIVEQKMSENRWDEINYSAVPSRANVIYNKAFWRHDADRRAEFLDKVDSGEEKINSSVNFPHDIVHMYGFNMSKYYCGFDKIEVDQAIEELWKALPDVGEIDNTLVVSDGSGSMYSTVGNTKITAVEVASSLATYFAERCTGQFKNKFITFSMTPKLVNIGDGTLLSKIQNVLKENEVANTNIEAVFNLILDTAVNNEMSQDEMPKNIIVISDMEFDSMASDDRRYGRGVRKTLFQELGDKYKEHGYRLPRLIFWNVCSRTNTIPVIQNELGVNLVSGFSVNTVKMALTGELDPLKALLSVINSERYDIVQKCVEKVLSYPQLWCNGKHA